MSVKNYLHSLPRVALVGGTTPVQHLKRLSEYLQRDIYIKRDDVSHLGMGGNKLRKLEFLVADALNKGCDTLVSSGAIQSNHVRQSTAAAAHLGLKCVASLENPIQTAESNYLWNGNHLLYSLMGCKVEMVDELNDPDALLQQFCTRLSANGAKPYIVSVGGSNALGSLGYVECALDIAEQCDRMNLNVQSVMVPSGSAGTHAGLAVGFAHCQPDVEVVGVSVSLLVGDQQPKVEKLQRELSAMLDVASLSSLTLCDDYFAPRYGMPNTEGMHAVELLARLEGIMLDPVYTGKAMAGLIDGVKKSRFNGSGPELFFSCHGQGI